MYSLVPNHEACKCNALGGLSEQLAVPVHRDEIKDPSCQARVTRTQEVAASDIRFDIPLAEACHQDRQLYCSGVAAGSARVIRCLQDRFAA